MTISDDMVKTKILLSLPDQYKHFSSAWDSCPEADRTLDNLRARLLKEEEKFKGSNKEDHKVAYKAMFKNKQPNNKGACNGCNLPGHYKRDCPNAAKTNQNTNNNASTNQHHQRQHPSTSRYCQKCNTTTHNTVLGKSTVQNVIHQVITLLTVYAGKIFPPCKYYISSRGM